MLESRVTRIAEKLEKNGNVEVRQLASELNVTEKTIRHDLIKMERMGLLKRVHGGAISNIRKAEDAYANQARTISLKAKERIAAKAFEYIRSVTSTGEVLYIDAGTTNYEFARYLKNTENIIITNDLLIASNLSTSSVTLHITGGRIFNNVNKYLVGSDALDMIAKHDASFCFVGASSIDAEKGLMTLNNEDAEIKKAMIAHSKTVICLADHTKFANTSFARFADTEKIDLIITDSIEEEYRKKIEEKGVKVLIADDDDSKDQ
mgnify:CR=1 FL=1